MVYSRRKKSVFHSLIRWIGVILLFAIIAFLSSYLEKNNSNLSLSGIAKAVDGDSLLLNGERIRILNIDAPEYDQYCKDGNNQSYNCGLVATKRMKKLVSLGETICKSEGYDKYDRILATCFVNEKDIGAIMVKEGLAIEYGAYIKEQRSAKSRELGLWAGEFITPREWRSRN